MGHIFFLSMAKQIKQISVFISSPSDVSAERKAALDVIDELNRTICESYGITLKPLTWEKNIYPSVGEYPQDVINKQIGEYDIFVGIMANRFGTPTPKAGSGTEEEFNIAYENRGNTQIMFFFKDSPILPSKLDLEQLVKVRAFKEVIANQGVLSKEFSEDFERIFRESLTNYLSNRFSNNDENRSQSIPNKIQQLKSKLVKTLFSSNPTYNKYSVINALAIPNSQFKLKKIYVPQTLVKGTRFEDNQETTLIDTFPAELIKKYQKILITDTAGMGKSTIMKFMFIDLIDNNIRDIGIPIYIELNRLNKDHSILDRIQEELKFLSIDVNKDLLSELFRSGGFIFFLDGYDEISILDRDVVTKDIQNFISFGTHNYYVLTSRPEERLTSFGDFQSFKIQPLKKEEAFELLKKYDEGKNKELSKKLVKLLKSGDYNSIDEYLENPLLVSLLYAAFDHKQTIPLKKHLFYRQVYEAYFDSHDLTKGIEARKKYSGLDIDDFNRVLRYVGYECLIKIGVQFDKDTILSLIDRSREFCGVLDFGSNDFLKDLLTTVPLFRKDGTGYKWAHKSLMEYFAARFIFCDAKQNQDKILAAIYKSELVSKYLNMLDLYYDIDLKGFSKNITLPLCESYIKFHDDNCIIDSSVSKKLVEQRISWLFLENNAFTFFVTPKTITKTDARNLFIQTELGYDYLVYRIPLKKEEIFIAKNIDHHLDALIKLLFRKKPSLGVSLGNCESGIEVYEELRKRWLFKENNILKYDKIYIIDSRTGDKNEETYKFCSLIMGVYRFWDIDHIDYEACKREVERIKKEIAQSDDSSGLLVGI